jgi:hypothetical protein
LLLTVGVLVVVAGVLPLISHCRGEEPEPFVLCLLRLVILFVLLFLVPQQQIEHTTHRRRGRKE